MIGKASERFFLTVKRNQTAMDFVDGLHHTECGCERLALLLIIPGGSYESTVVFL